MKRIIYLVFLLTACAFATVNYPYPQEATYAYGTRATVDGQSATLKTKFETFKTNYYAESGDYARIKDDHDTYTVSEGIGYGMIMMVYFSDETTSYQDEFDKLWNYFQKWENSNGLMNWEINGFSNVIGENGATDADEDVAFALTMAYYQFGDVAYKTAASELIANIRQHEFNSSDYLHRPGDAWDDYKNPSYVSPAAYQLFEDFDESSFWSNALSANYTLLKSNQNSSSGLPSGWCTTSGSPVVGNNSDGQIAYDYDASRAPWRWAWSYAWFGHSDASSLLSTLSAWVNTKSASNLKVSMYVDGSSMSNSWSNSTAVGPLACTQMYSDSYQTHLNTLTNVLLNKGTDSYFNDALQVLTGLLLTGNMPNLADVTTTPVSSSSVESSSSIEASSSSVESSSSIETSSSSVESSSSIETSSSSVESSSSSSVATTTDWVAVEAIISSSTSTGVTIGSGDWSEERVVTKVLGTLVAGSTYTVSFDAFEQSGGEDMDLDVAIGSYSDETETLAGGELSSFTYTFTATETGVVTMTLTMPASRWESVAISNLSITGGPLALQRSIAAADFSMEVTADRLVVNFSTSGYTRVDVFDMQGRLAASLLQANASGVQSLSLSAIPSGSYIVRIQQGSQSLMQRISIDR